MKDEIKKGAFHKWLGKSPNEKITASDISKGLASDSEHVRKMAQFAKNMQHIQEDTMTGLTNLIKLANDKNPTEFKSVFNDLMGSRLRDALEIRRVEIASSICQESTTESKDEE